MNGTTLTVALQSATEQQLAAAAGTPAELALRARLRQIHNTVAHRQYRAEAAARRAAYADERYEDAMDRKRMRRACAELLEDVDRLLAGTSAQTTFHDRYAAACSNDASASEWRQLWRDLCAARGPHHSRLEHQMTACAEF